MNLRGALLAEGPSDRPLTQVLERLCRRPGVGRVEIEWGNEHLERYCPGRSIASKVSTLLEIDPGYDIVFVHRDADARDPSPRLAEIDQVFSTLELHPPHVRIVPIQETEAWLLVDESAIRDQLRIPSSHPLHLPKPKHIEQRANPKELLKQVLARALTRRRSAKVEALSDRRFGELRAQLLVSLDIQGPVTQLSAWQQLVQDIDRAFELLLTSIVPEPPTA
ncbi:MAG: DUF4276 family protein [Enhygromyxa sp.]